jgi:hypothetical protein
MNARFKDRSAKERQNEKTNTNQWRKTMRFALNDWMRWATPVAAALLMTVGMTGVAMAHDDESDDWYYGRHHDWHYGWHHDWHSGPHYGEHNMYHWDPVYGWHYGEHYGPHSGTHHDWHYGPHHDWYWGHGGSDEY